MTFPGRLYITAREKGTNHDVGIGPLLNMLFNREGTRFDPFKRVHKHDLIQHLTKENQIFVALLFCSRLIESIFSPFRLEAS